MLPRYKATPSDETPVAVSEPTFHVCSLENSKLTVPASVRSQWITDPIRAPEWRKLLTDFDRQWAEPQAAAQGTRAVQPAAATAAATSAATETGELPPTETKAQFDWGSIFPDAASTKTDLDQKFGAALHSFTVSAGLQGAIFEGPQLYLIATQDSEVNTTEPVFTYGAGSWLLDNKASTYLQARDIAHEHILCI